MSYELAIRINHTHQWFRWIVNPYDVLLIKNIISLYDNQQGSMIQTTNNQNNDSNAQTYQK